ncbi:MAG TPA: SRPBCC family protein [Chthoniobacteraceae bacterium]|nr:SRPBCC family protein [Chthoniobacteraceae bacterium]
MASAFCATPWRANQPPPNLYSASSIQIRAPRGHIFDLAQDIVRWPESLPDYRKVTDAGRDPVGRPKFCMTVRRAGLPVIWTAVCDIDETALELRFEHLTGWTKGMKEVWTFTPTRDGTRAEIVQNLAFRVPPLAPLVEPVIGVVLVRSLARKSLTALKQAAEKQQAA